jgi:hypothetical protein
MSPKASREKVLRREAVRLDAPAALQVACVAFQSLSGKIQEAKHMSPRHINPVQWQQAMDYARQACARIFRDGGSPSDAVRAFGLVMGDAAADWCTAVDRIAHALCAPALRRAA